VSKTRRLIWVAVVLLFAGAVSWWSAKNESGVTQHIQKEVSLLVPNYVKNPKSLQGVVVDPLLEPALATTIQRVFDYSVAQQQSVVVVVTEGDSLLYGDGSATHTALLEVDQQVVGGLRIVCFSEFEPVLVAGVFKGVPQ
jgi:hypothetical protein